jgi:DNA end-binding protein Ku
MVRNNGSSSPPSVAEASAVPARGQAGAPSRASWSGLMRLSLVVVPVKAYPATSSTETISFNQLHADCGQRIHYHKVCPVHGKVESEAIARGYQYAPDQYVVLEEAELEQFRPPKDRGLVLEQCLEAHQIDAALFAGRTLYLVPEGLPAQRPYLVLQAALRRQGKAALGRITLSGHRHVALVRPTGRLLSMHLLHDPAKVRSFTALETGLRDGPASQEEEQLAAMLVDSITGTIDWARYQDDTAEKLSALIEAKIAGQLCMIPAEEPVQVFQLLDALKQSVAAATESSKPNSSKRGQTSRRRSA